jgi:hypothetical protein
MYSPSPFLRLISIALALGFASSFAKAEEGVMVPAFVEDTSTAGVTSIYAGEWQYMVGGGVAAFDCNGDSYPDLALAGGEVVSSIYVNKSARGGALHFAKQESGAELKNVTGFYPLDIDGDGVMDLVVLRVGEIVLLRGRGACHFERANELWNFNGGNAWWTSFSATWEKGNKWPTLAFGAYIDPAQESNPWGSCTANQLYRPKAEGGYSTSIPLTPSYCALSILFTDWNRSGTPSLRVSNDREYYEGGQEQLWHIEPGEEPRLYTDPEGWKFLKIWGMGIASTNFPDELYPSYFLTSMSDNKLQVLRPPQQGQKPQPSYRDSAYDRGVVAYRPYMGDDLKPSTAWHAQFEDMNNDGRSDLFIAKGNVDRMPDFAQKDPSNLLLQKSDAHFVEVGDVSGIASFAIARGAILADFNLDGKMDLAVVNRRENAKIWRNVSTEIGSFIALRLETETSNRDAIGAWIEVKTASGTQRREITSGGGHASGQNGYWHFGLGTATSADMRVIWPDGTEGPWQTVTAGKFYRVSPGQEPVPWVPSAQAN